MNVRDPTERLALPADLADEADAIGLRLFGSGVFEWMRLARAARFALMFLIRKVIGNGRIVYVRREWA